MNKEIKTGEEILEIIKSNMTVADFGYDYFDHNVLELGPIKVVDKYGGEDCGSEYYKVYYFEEHDVYIRIEGWYSSYDGANFDDYGSVVRPAQKTITVYE